MQQLTSALRFMRGEEAADVFGFKDLVEKMYSGIFDVIIAENKVLVHDGDLEVSGELNFDYGFDLSDPVTAKQLGMAEPLPGGKSTHCPEETVGFGLFVNGNLTVNGSIVNCDPYEIQAYLLVKGNVRAKNILYTGTLLGITGTTTIENALFFPTSHGTVALIGLVKAKYIIEEGDCSVNFIEYDAFHASENHYAGIGDCDLEDFFVSEMRHDDEDDDSLDNGKIYSAILNGGTFTKKEANTKGIRKRGSATRKAWALKGLIPGE